jgi:hypothetical protein
MRHCLPAWQVVWKLKIIGVAYIEAVLGLIEGRQLKPTPSHVSPVDVWVS